MNKNTGLGILVIVLVLLGFYTIMNYKTDYLWYEDYHSEEDQPYHTSVFQKLMKEKDGVSKVNEPFQVSLKDSSFQHHDIFFLHNQFHLNDTNEFDAFFSHISKGNNALIVTKSIASKSVYVEHKKEEEDEEEDTWNNGYHYEEINLLKDRYNLRTDQEYTSKVQHNLIPSKTELVFNRYHVTYDDRFDTTSFYSNYFMHADSAEVVGLANGESSLLRFKVGEGNLYFMSTPILFTNQPVVTQEGFNYLNELFKLTNMEDSILWDQYHYHQYYQYDTESSSGGSNYDNKNRKIKTPFSFIFDRISLRLAWYVALTTLVLYMIFYLRRKQRIVPIIYPRKNLSLEFAKSIGLLYLLSNHHKYIIRYQMRHLLQFIRRKYQINIKANAFEGDIASLSMKSGLSSKDLQSIFEYYTKLSKLKEVSDRQLLLFNEKMKAFYKKCN